jgi:hypothetical protein
LKVILDIHTKNADLIAQAKDTQWRVQSFAILLFVVVTGAVQLTRALWSGNIYRTVLGAGAAVCVGVIYYAARKIMGRVNDELIFYREYSKINEEMLNITVGIHALANKAVSSRREALSGIRDFAVTPEENRAEFTLWMYRLLAGSAFLAFLVCELLVWAGTKT